MVTDWRPSKRASLEVFVTSALTLSDRRAKKQTRAQTLKYRNETLWRRCAQKQILQAVASAVANRERGNSRTMTGIDVTGAEVALLDPHSELTGAQVVAKRWLLFANRRSIRYSRREH